MYSEIATTLDPTHTWVDVYDLHREYGLPTDVFQVFNFNSFVLYLEQMIGIGYSNVPNIMRNMINKIIIENYVFSHLFKTDSTTKDSYILEYVESIDDYKYISSNTVFDTTEFINKDIIDLVDGFGSEIDIDNNTIESIIRILSDPTNQEDIYNNIKNSMSDFGVYEYNWLLKWNDGTRWSEIIYSDYTLVILSTNDRPY